MQKKKKKTKAFLCPVFSNRMGFFPPRNLQTSKTLHQIGFTHLPSFQTPMQDCWDSYRGLWKAETFGIHPVYNVLLAPIPYIPTPNHSSSHSELKSKRKPEPSVPVQLLALLLPGSTAPLMVRSQANMYLTGITKIRKVQGSSFWKTHSSCTSKGSLICCWSHDQSGAKWVKRGEKIKSNLRSVWPIRSWSWDKSWM